MEIKLGCITALVLCLVACFTDGKVRKGLIRDLYSNMGRDRWEITANVDQARVRQLDIYDTQIADDNTVYLYGALYLQSRNKATKGKREEAKRQVRDDSAPVTFLQGESTLILTAVPSIHGFDVDFDNKLVYFLNSPAENKFCLFKVDISYDGEEKRQHRGMTLKENNLKKMFLRAGPDEVRNYNQIEPGTDPKLVVMSKKTLALLGKNKVCLINTYASLGDAECFNFKDGQYLSSAFWLSESRLAVSLATNWRDGADRLALNLVDFSYTQKDSTIVWNLEAREDVLKAFSTGHYSENENTLYHLVPFRTGILYYILDLKNDKQFPDAAFVISDPNQIFTIMDGFAVGDQRQFMIIKQDSTTVLYMYDQRRIHMNAYYVESASFGAMTFNFGRIFYMERLSANSYSLWNSPLHSVNAISSIQIYPEYLWKSVRDLNFTQEYTRFQELQLHADVEPIPMDLDYIVEVSQQFVVPVQFQLEPIFIEAYNSKRIEFGTTYSYTERPQDINIAYRAAPIMNNPYPDGIKVEVDTDGQPQWFVDLPHTENLVEYFFSVDTVAANKRGFAKPVRMTLMQCVPNCRYCEHNSADF